MGREDYRELKMVRDNWRERETDKEEMMGERGEEGAEMLWKRARNCYTSFTICQHIICWAPKINMSRLSNSNTVSRLLIKHYITLSYSFAKNDGDKI